MAAPSRKAYSGPASAATTVDEANDGTSPVSRAPYDPSRNAKTPKPGAGNRRQNFIPDTRKAHVRRHSSPASPAANHGGRDPNAGVVMSPGGSFYYGQPMVPGQEEGHRFQGGFSYWLGQAFGHGQQGMPQQQFVPGPGMGMPVGPPAAQTGMHGQMGQVVHEGDVNVAMQDRPYIDPTASPRADGEHGGEAGRMPSGHDPHGGAKGGGPGPGAPHLSPWSSLPPITFMARQCAPLCVAVILFVVLVIVIPVLAGENKLVPSSGGGGGGKSAATGVPIQVIRNCVEADMVALTFDAGPSVYTQEVMDLVEAAGGHVTFFISGVEDKCLYLGSAAIRRMRRNGHQIGIRSWSGRAMTSLAGDALRRELRLLAAALLDIAGVVPLYLRPPSGFYAADVMAAMREVLAPDSGGTAVTSDDPKLVLWTVDGKDWDGDVTFFQAQHNAITSQRYRETGPISVLHDGSWNMRNLFLPWLINWTKTNKMQMVTVGTCIGLPEASDWYSTRVQMPNPPSDITAAACTALETADPAPPDPTAV